jgi:hypothetical protein
MKTKTSCLLLMLVLFALIPVSHLAQDPTEKKKIVDMAKPYTLRVHAIALSDSRGARATAITPEQVKQWVDKANELFKLSGANIQLTFNAGKLSGDWEVMKNTTLNNLDSGGTSWKEANEIAAQHPHEIVYFFRWGPGATPTGNGFSFPPAMGCNFVALPGFNNTTVTSNGEVSVQNIWQLAHDTGHFLGLPHTFPGWGGTDTNDWDDSKNIAQAGETADYIAKLGGTAKALDGDGLSDTPAEAGAGYYIYHGWKMCSEHESYTISGKKSDGTPFTLTFKPARNNVMSYFACEPMRFTAEQVNRMRATLQSPARNQLLQ